MQSQIQAIKLDFTDTNVRKLSHVMCPNKANHAIESVGKQSKSVLKMKTSLWQASDVK